ncbi:MAG: hypothetical protein IBX69_06920 [Anaerolineales bacterium]|nr:hypothetical protein [Anaerolineales bacterium]
MAENTPIFVFLAVAMLSLIGWRIKPTYYRQLPWWVIAVVSACFWGILTVVLVLTAWQSYYGLFQPATNRYLIPAAAVLVYPLWSLLLRWLSLRIPGNPAVFFCLLGGVQSIMEHSILIFVIKPEVPIIQQSSPLAILIFAYLEYVVFWSLVLLIAVGIYRITQKPSGKFRN